MKQLLTHPLFLLGLVAKLGFVLLILPQATTDWYAPFMDATALAGVIDPWRYFLAQGGDPAAFPYGYVMWLLLLPLTWACMILQAPVAYGYALTLLGADIALLAVLERLVPRRPRLLLCTYWLSPIILLATYWLGLNDLIPVLLLTIALYFTKQRKFTYAGFLSIAAVSAKLSMILAVPFFIIYLFRNPALRRLLPEYIKGLGWAVLLFGLPFLFSPAGLYMLFSNPELAKIYQISLSVGERTQVYLLPLAYLVMLYLAWRVRRLNFALFQALLGIAFLLVVLLTPASPGWFIWATPLLVLYQASSGRVAAALTLAFSLLYVLTTLLAGGLPFPLSAAFTAHVGSLLHTAMTAIGIVLGLRMWRETVSKNDYFRLSRKPFTVGIAGDSGAGKDTLANALQGLFGSHSVTHLSGDDYHLWDRQKPIWQVMTHLNPMANDLEAYANDLLALADGKPVLARHYDHGTGKRSRPAQVKSNDFIFATGLHALYLPILRDCYDLRIYLDIDERLRRHYKLRRDVGERGHTAERVLAALAKREPDSARFIRPQEAHADLVLALKPTHPLSLDDSEEPRVKLGVRSRNGMNGLSLTRVLVGVCGLHVDTEVNNETDSLTLTIEGDTSSEDIALAACMLFPRMLEFLDINPQWRDGTLGLMQLVTLAHISQAFDKRLL